MNNFTSFLGGHYHQSWLLVHQLSKTSQISPQETVIKEDNSERLRKSSANQSAKEVRIAPRLMKGTGISINGGGKTGTQGRKESEQSKQLKQVKAT